MSVKELAQRLGISRTEVESLETGAPVRIAGRLLPRLLAAFPSLTAYRHEIRALARVPVEPPSEGPAEARPLFFADALRVEREHAGLTQHEIGELLDVSQTAVSDWETRSSTPIQDHVDALLQLFPRLALAPDPNPKDMLKPGRVPGLPSDPTPPKETPPDMSQKAAPLVPVTPGPPPTEGGLRALAKMVPILNQIRRVACSPDADPFLELLSVAAKEGVSVAELTAILVAFR
jgi:transcriptional regulator with XRE-family HTH domain